MDLSLPAVGVAEDSSVHVGFLEAVVEPREDCAEGEEACSLPRGRGQQAIYPRYPVVGMLGMDPSAQTSQCSDGMQSPPQLPSGLKRGQWENLEEKGLQWELPRFEIKVARTNLFEQTDYTHKSTPWVNPLS